MSFKIILHTVYCIPYTRNGAAILPVVLIVSAIIMEVAITSILIANIFGSAAFNSRIANEALSAAEAGAHDGIIKVIRNCPIGPIAGTACFSSYAIPVGDRSASIDIKEDPDGSFNKIVVSSANILGRIKRVEARLTINQITGETNIRSFKECYNYDSQSGLCT